MAVLFLNSCYSEYKAIPGTRIGNTGDIYIQSDVDATAIFPFIPRYYRTIVTLTNQGNKPVYISGMVVKLKRNSRKSERLLSSLSGDTILLKPGEFRAFPLEFAKRGPVAFPHKVTVDVTASLRDSNGQTTISQSLQYIRYMYVNVGGD
jgi:hypothetical protein